MNVLCAEIHEGFKKNRAYAEERDGILGNPTTLRMYFDVPRF